MADSEEQNEFDDAAVVYPYARGSRYLNQVNENVVDLDYIPQRKVGRFYFAVKRLFDVVASSLAIVVLSPVLCAAALAVKLTSRGPVLFRDKRVGQNGKIIDVLKFRSMYIDSESNPTKYLSPAQMVEWKRERKVKNDPRITKVGRFLRKTSIDELPQLFNIWIGNMSVVGPRPVTKREIEENFTPAEQAVILSAKPGLTGYWQVYGRSDVSYESGRRSRLTLDYFAYRSLGLDLELILLTIPAVLKGSGAE